MTDRPRTFVLVHGAWHGGWCWRPVTALLEKQGHRVYAPSLTGLADRAHLLDAKTNVSTHIDDVARLIAWEDLEDVVLVGHSYGGFVISGVADRVPRSIASIVYLDAFLPESGQALIDSVADGSKFRASIQEAIARGDLSVPVPPAAAFGVPEADQAWVGKKCTPQPTACFAERIRLNGGLDRIAKRTYIRALGNPQAAFDQAQAAAARRGWRVVEMACGHDVMIAMPESLTAILLEAA